MEIKPTEVIFYKVTSYTNTTTHNPKEAVRDLEGNVRELEEAINSIRTQQAELERMVTPVEAIFEEVAEAEIVSEDAMGDMVKALFEDAKFCHGLVNREYERTYDFRKVCLNHVDRINALTEIDIDDIEGEFYDQVVKDTTKSWGWISNMSQQAGEDLEWFSDVYRNIFALAAMHKEES